MSEKNTPPDNNPFEKAYSSKIDPIDIPLPGFHYFHGASSEENVDTKFIGREKITKQLKSWLTDSKTKTGVYLVTGFRGMGKSSFVGKVLNETTKNSSKTGKWYWYAIILCIIFSSFTFLVSFFEKNSSQGTINLSFIHKTIFFTVNLASTSLMLYYVENILRCTITKNRKFQVFLFCIAFIIFLGYLFSFCYCINTLYCAVVATCLFLVAASILGLFYWGINKKYQKGKIRERLPIKLNLGHEILNGRDILSLIAKSIQIEFRKYSTDIAAQKKRGLSRVLIISICSLLLSIFLIKVLYPGIKPVYETWINEPYSKTILYYLSQTSWKFIKNIDEIGFFPDTLHKHHHMGTYIVTFGGVFTIIFFLWIQIKKIIYPYFGESYSKVTKDLKVLNERIISSVNEDSGPGGGFSSSIFGLSINNRRRHNYPIADVREIELELSNILNRMSKLSNAPEFIIVFDELDKIDPVTNHEIDQESEIIPEYESTGSGFPGGATSRKRKQNILRLLANMKFFISTAKVKFIFIAGRELYDAFLADISDREFTVNSIFNGVINVDSFLSSKQDRKNITFMAEQFICKQLYTESEAKDIKEKDYNFQSYKKILWKRYDKTPEEKEINKIITFLSHFALYLSHVSNGAPKKISTYFEKYVENGTKNKGIIMPKPKKGNCSYYLHFGYKDQRKIGFINYMAAPLAQTIFNSATQYGDKLLVSASFLTNQIYKYHNNGFSWRNLENVPELLEVNRTPELREFINIIVSHLKKSHLSTIISGLYNFKFPRRISDEISLMSKFSEEISALFNFTLDDSLSVKRHYTQLLKYYTSLTKKTNDLHHVIVGIHHILGDLHHLDEAYNEAVFEYQSGIQILANEKIDINDPHYPSHILVLTRMMLKLGLVHEKRRTYNAAYIIYNDLISNLIRFRYIDESELGMEYSQKLREEYDWRDREDILYHKKYPRIYPIPDYEKKVQPQIFNPDFDDYTYKVSGDDIIPQFSRQLTPEKNSIIARLSMFEDIRLIYQPLLAKLFVLEKEGLSGITRENLEVMESEFLFLHRSVHYKEEYMISADFFRKVGDILYYKNGMIDEESYNFCESLYLRDFDISKEIYNHCCKKEDFKNYGELHRMIKFISCTPVRMLYHRIIDKDTSHLTQIEVNENIAGLNYLNNFAICRIRTESTGNTINILIDRNIYKKMINCTERRQKLLSTKVEHRDRITTTNKRIPCFACKYYTRSLNILAGNLVTENPSILFTDSKALFFLSLLNQKNKFKSLKETDLIILASSLDGLGNALFSCSCKNDHITEDFLRNFSVIIQDSNYEKFSNWQTTHLSHIEKSLLYYWTAASYFKYASNLKEASLRYKKVIQVLAAYISIHQDSYDKIKGIKDNLAMIEKVVFSRAIQNIYSYYENTNMLEIEQLKELLNKKMYDKIPLNLLSHFPDMEELALGYYELELLCGKTEQIVKLYKGTLLSKYRLENTISERVISLKFKAMVNMEILNQLIRYSDYIYKNEQKNNGVIYQNLTEFEFSKHYKKYLSPQTPLEVCLGKYKEYFQITQSTDEVQQKIHMVEFLIGDTIFCLTKIIEMISTSTKTTLFSHSYMGGIYQLLFECYKIYEYLYRLYQHIEYGEKMQKETLKKIEDGIKISIGVYAQKRLMVLMRQKQNEALLFAVVKLFSKGSNLPDKNIMNLITEKNTTIPCDLRIRLKDKSLTQGIEIINNYKSDYVRNLQKQLFLEYLKYISTMQNKHYPNDRNNIYNETNLLIETVGRKKVFIDIDECLSDISKQIKPYIYTNHASNFKNNIKEKININHIYNSSTYLAETAIKYYRSAQEMHREGIAYKEMIANMHFLDDDLDNDTCQFYFAIERYMDNCGYVDAQIDKLVKICKQSSMMEVNSYLE